MLSAAVLARRCAAATLRRAHSSATAHLAGYDTRTPKDYPKTFDKILIANRGEIACRVMKTCKKMGIKSVAVFSDADANAQHVQMADEAVRVGPPPTSQSYLSIPNILEAIRKSGAQAVHPGYGFLSENSRFVDALDKHGVTFIGPSTQAMHDMGDKIESKKIAAEAGVNTVPGFKGEVRDLTHALEIANDIGYPVMIKASAGGGGKGMRVAWNDQEVRDNFELIKSEAKSSFADDRLLIERFVDNPRHIEVQILGDKLGNVVYLPERECSIQRRNQKVIEEAPSTHLDEKTRRAMGEQAVALARRVGYYSAGTVEFLVDAQRNWYFLEMNTRLQVEHPITELITGYDLVEQMIRVAAGHPLAMKQEDVTIHGHALESRVYAEDPEKYLPSIGTLAYYVEPTTQSVIQGSELRLHPATQDALVRCDSGIEEGSEISIYYDPMICKLATWAPTRDGAIQAMQRSLDAYVIKGVTHNIPLLRSVVSHPRFQKGDISTKFLPEEYPQGYRGLDLAKHPQLARDTVRVAAAVHAARAARDRAFANYATTPTPAENELVVSVKPLRKARPGEAPPEPVSHTVRVRPAAPAAATVASSSSGGGAWEVAIDGQFEPLALAWELETPLITADLGGRGTLVAQYVDATPLGFHLQVQGSVLDVTVLTPAQVAASKHMIEKKEADAASRVVAPMPGAVVSVAVKPGDVVAEGSALCVVEAMKMQNVLRAARAARVKRVLVKPGQAVAADELMIEFETENGNGNGGKAAAPKK